MRHFIENIYIGNKHDAEDVVSLKEKAICVTLNVANDLISPYHSGIRQFKIGMDDPQEGLAPDNPVWIAVEALHWAQIFASTRNMNVLIHCHARHNRSSLIAALWAQRYYKMGFKKAIKKAQVKDNKPWMKEFGLEW